MRASFSIGLYDKDGDKYEDGIFINLIRNMQDNYPIIVKVDKVEEIEELSNHLAAISREIRENY